MNRRFHHLRWIGLLCFMALLATHALGAGRVFWCVCGEKPVITKAVSCEPVHFGESEEEECPSAPSAPAKHRDHLTVKDDLRASLGGKVTVPPVNLLPLMPWLVAEILPPSFEQPLAPEPRHLRPLGEPPPHVAMGRSVVILI